MAALLAIALDSSPGSVPGLSMQAVHLLVSPDLLPLLAKPTDPEQVLLPSRPHRAPRLLDDCTSASPVAGIQRHRSKSSRFPVSLMMRLTAFT